MSKTFFHRSDLVVGGIALGGTALLTLFDKEIARASQRGRRNDAVTGAQTDDLSIWSLRISKVNETTLTLAGVATYGIARLARARTVSDIALHATESVVLASVASQLIRGPLGRTRPFVTKDSNEYDFHPGKGFFGKNSFDYRAFPSIHTSSSMAVATVLTMELNRRHSDATKFVAPVLYGAALLPGLARIKLDQHWASDIAAGAFMGVFFANRVVSYSHAHPDNKFDRFFLSATVAPGADGTVMIGLSPKF
jgi:membrane-associated phospholipid phosphatase